MTISRRTVLAGAAASSLAQLPFQKASANSIAPRPFGAVPNSRQLAWQASELNAFVHFSINTFTGREWGYGDESPALFDPTDFDAGQIVGTAKAGGMRGVILTAKHHDGFCLWPSRHTEHCIRNSPYRNGKGDIVREMSNACRDRGLGFGVYLSPWDRNRADYGYPSYIDYYRAQLRELMNDYGPIFEVWFDGANGGDGYYGGAREKRSIDAHKYYDWPNTWKIVRDLQPEALIWGAEGSDARWIGNEDGVANDPCWPTMDEGAYTQEKGGSGVRGGAVWWPAEVDVSIRPGWFWHDYENDQVKSPGRLLRLYLESVGRGANLLLNMPPDRRGRIPEQDVQALIAWGDMMRAAFARNLAKGARAHASNVRGGSQAFAATNVIDERSDSYWATDDAAKEAVLTLDLPTPESFDLIRLREYLPLGLRVGAAALEVQQGDAWQEIARFEGIGSQRLIRLPAPVTAHRVRLQVLDAGACPAISEFALFRLPLMVEPPVILRDRTGLVSIRTEEPGGEIVFTTDGTEPVADSPRYRDPFSFADGGLVKARTLHKAGGAVSSVVTAELDLAKGGWRIIEASSPDARAAIDESAASLWVAALPASLAVDLGKICLLKGFTLQPGTPPPRIGVPGDYRVLLSTDGQTWTLAAAGEFSNIAANRSGQRIAFPEAGSARYLKLVIGRAAGAEDKIGLAELGVLTR